MTSLHPLFVGLILWAAMVSDSPSDPLAKGKAFLDEMKYEEAVAHLTEAIKADPKNPKAYYYRGLSYLNSSRSKDAIADFDRAIRLDPKAAKTFLRRGEARRTQGDLDEAIADATEAIRLEPSNVEALRLRAFVYQDKREHGKAAADHKKTIEINPEDPIAHYSLAHILSTSPDPKVRDAKRAVKYAVKVCELEKWKSGSTVVMLASVHAIGGAFDEAVKYQKKAIEVLKAEGANVYLEQETLKRYETIVCLNRAIQADPEEPEGYYRRGMVSSEVFLHEKAIADFSQAIRLNPKSGEYFFERGRAHLVWGRAFELRSELEKAIADFTEAVRLDPKDLIAIDHLSKTYYEIGEFAKAAQIHRKQIASDPNNGISHSYLAMILAVCPDPKVRNGKKAVEYARKACEIYKWEVDNYIEILAAAHAETGVFDEAVKYQKKAMELTKANGFDPLVNTIDRLKLYEARKPVRCRSLFSDW